MTYMALAVVYMLACTVLGLARGRRISNALLASFAAAMVCAQLALLFTR